MSADAYSNKPPAYFSAGRPEMLRFVPVQARRVLEVGCGRGMFASALKARQDVHIVAIEPSADAATEAAGRVDVLIENNVESGLQGLLAASFDCVVFNDVLEHLVDPWAALKKVRLLLAPEGVVVASIPNMRYMTVLRALVTRGEWTYREDGVLDRTHLRFFTAGSIRGMFLEAGYEIVVMDGINERRTWKIDLLNLLTANRFSDTNYQQFAVVAAPAVTPTSFVQ